MRIYAATLGTETNTFSPIPTSRASFEETLYAPPGRHPDQITLFTAPLWVARRRARDATLPAPRLILPSLQVNIRAGRLPPAEADGVRYLRLPLDRLGEPS